MKARRSSFNFLITFLLFSGLNTFAQTDLELYSKYVQENESSSTMLHTYRDKYAEPDYENVSLQGAAYQTLFQLIKDKRQAEVRNVYVSNNDTTDLVKIFKLLRQFPKIAVLSFSTGYETRIKKQYSLPEDITKLPNLKFVRIYGADNLNAADLLSTLRKIPLLRGVDLLDYRNEIPVNETLPGQLAFVKLSTSQLKNLNTDNDDWRFARIQQRVGVDDNPKDEDLLHKLANMKSLEILDFQSCYVTDGDIFKRFTKLRKLTIEPLLKDGAKFVTSLSTLTSLKELSIKGILDTSQSFSDLDKFQDLELLDLHYITRFQSHPEELENIGKLTKLRSLAMYSCNLSFCPDFFSSLKMLESFTFKFNLTNWNKENGFMLPASLYILPELKSLTIWKGISELPSILNLAKLEVLDLNYNHLKSVPDGLSNSKFLKSLSLSDNLFEGSLNNRWGDFTTLESLDLSRNKISVYPEGLQHLYQLKYLNLASNNIIKIPQLHVNTYQLRVFLIDNNKLDNLPENFRFYKKLEVLSANYCGLNSLPSDMGSLRQLKEINLQGSHLKILPYGMGSNSNLTRINLQGNTELQEESIFDVIFRSPKKHFLWADLANTGLKTLPANVPWERLKFVLELSGNHLNTLPVEMAKMEWFNINLRNNPLPVDTGFMEMEITSRADAKIFFQELGYKTKEPKVNSNEMAISMTKAVNFLTRYHSFEKAVKYAKKANELDSNAYNQNINRYSLGMSLYKTKNYKEATLVLNKYILHETHIPSGLINDIELALSASFNELGQKRKAADIHAYFANKHSKPQSFLYAALDFLELKEIALSNKYLDEASLMSKAEYDRFPGSKGFYIYDYAEILLMANKPAQVVKLFKEEDPKLTGQNRAYRDYLEAVASLMVNPDNYEQLKKEYLTKLNNNGKMKDWNYDNFNRWVKASDRSSKEKEYLYELEKLNK